jgi:hypothetical protein
MNPVAVATTAEFATTKMTDNDDNFNDALIESKAIFDFLQEQKKPKAPIYLTISTKNLRPISTSKPINHRQPSDAIERQT